MVVRPPTRVYGFGRILQNVQTVTFFPKKGVCYAFSDRRIIYNYVCPGCFGRSAESKHFGSEVRHRKLGIGHNQKTRA